MKPGGKKPGGKKPGGKKPGGKSSQLYRVLSYTWCSAIQGAQLYRVLGSAVQEYRPVL